MFVHLYNQFLRSFLERGTMSVLTYTVPNSAIAGSIKQRPASYEAGSISATSLCLSNLMRFKI